MLYIQLLNKSETFEKFRSHLHISDEPSPQDKRENLVDVSSNAGIIFGPKSIKMEAMANIFWLISLIGDVPIISTYSMK